MIKYNNEKSYLAVDLGASSGRLILGFLKDGKLCLQEIHRFENGYTERKGHLCWDFAHLFEEIKLGMKLTSKQGYHPVSIGIDTWGVDFVLLDKSGAVLGNTVSYRDIRTNGTLDQVYSKISRSELYARTGIAEQIYNTIFQLQAVKNETPELLEQADRLLFSPEYLAYLLCGNTQNEYTISSTSGLLCAHTQDWDYELLDLFGIPRQIVRKPVPSGTILGDLLPEIADEIGFSCQVILPGSHDTASAVLAVPCTEGDFVFLSSGTWSLLGTELKNPCCTDAYREAGFTNEGSYGGSIRLLKNIMGLWMIQSVRKELNGWGVHYDFGEIGQLAEAAIDFPSEVDVNDLRFLAPPSMIEAVKSYCRDTAQPIPETNGEVLISIYRGLANCYAKSIYALATLTGQTFSVLHLVGGGCQDDFLNRLTCKACDMTVLAGPIEATAIGNLIAQMLADQIFDSVAEARAVIKDSFSIKEYNKVRDSL